MKAIRYAALTALLLVAGYGAPEAAPAKDWRLESFEQANALYAKMQDDEQAFIVGKEPSLASFYRDVLGPWQAAMQRLRRLIFIRKLKEKPDSLQMSESPWTWALSTPARREEIEVWFAGDTDGSLQAAYKEVMRTLGALRPASQSVGLRNDVMEKYRPEVNAIESATVTALGSLEERVRQRLGEEARAPGA